jgi:hypothetical protein
MSKKFKNFRKSNRFDDEWGDVNEERIREKERAKMHKKRKQENRDRKHLNFKDFRDDSDY